jgi:hypothetical protein
LGVSPDAIRRRLKAGQLEGRREVMPQGFRWLVLLDGEVAQGGATRNLGAESRNAEASGGAQVADLAVARAQEMAAFTELLLTPYVRRIEELSREVGELRARLDDRPPTQSAPQADQWPERRRWWQRLLWG